MEATCESCTRRFFVPGAGVQEVACPSCGGNMVPERDQPSGVNSDGDLRNMSGPGYGQDMGGDPLTEGILAPSIAGERTQPMNKRDESFSSVKTAATAQATPSMPAGIHMGTMGALQFCGATINGMAPGPELYQWTIKEWLPAARAGEQRPVTVEVTHPHPAYLAAAVGIVNNSSACAGKRVPVEEFKTLVMGIQGGSIPPPNKQAKVAGEDDFDLGGWGFDEDDATASTHKFIVDSQGQIYSQEEPTHHEQVAETAGLDMSNFPQGLSLGSLNSDGTTEWYQHQSGLQPDHMAQGLEQHFGMPVTIDPSLKPSSSEERFGIEGPGAQGKGRSEIQIAQDPPMPRSYGVPRDRNEGLVRGGHLDQTIHLPYYAGIEKEAVLPLAVPAAMAVARIGGGLIAKKLAPKLVSGALKAGRGVASKGLKALGVHALIKGVSGAAGAGGGQAVAPRAVAPSLSEVSHVTADVETPSSVPALHENDGDTQQFKDGEATTNPEHPSGDDSGSGSMSPAGALLDHLLPKVLEWYDSEDAGENDPLMKALDEALEREMPGYKDMDDGDHSDLEAFFAELADSHRKEAAGQFFPGMGIQPGMQPGNAVVPPRAVGAPVGPQPGENACPGCGALLNPDGSCAQCGFAAENASQVNQAVTPGTSVGGPSLPPAQARVADTQGPYTPEQFKLVAEYLLEAGREAEIPHMYDAPYEYADILAEIQNKLNAPPPAVEAPAAPPAPPMDPAMGMDPSMAPPDPSQMQASIHAAVSRFAADNIAPKCPKCDSHTTGMIATEDGMSGRCHNCNNVWDLKDIAKTAEVAEHHHDQPVLEHSELDDQTDSPHPDANNLTWTTPDGEALTEGQEYEMHSDEYSIPDVIRVDQVKPGELVYTITGEYSELEDQTTITPEEVEQRGIKFLPVEGEMPTEETFDSTEPTPAARVPITTHVDVELSDGRVVQANLINGKIVIPKVAWQQVDDEILVADPGDRANGSTVVEVDNLTHHLDDGRALPAEEVVPNKVEPPKEAAWLLEGTNVSAAPAPWETPLPDLTGGSLEEIVAADEGERDWLVADLPKTAGAKFSPGEQRKFIDEDGEARNLDRLDLEDTHYKTREGSVFVAGRGAMRFAQPELAPDDHLVFGL